jgi:putative adhesin
MRQMALVGLLCAVGACGGRVHDVEDAFHWQTELPQGSTLHLRTSTGHIEVAPASGSTATVIGSKRWRGRNDAVHFSWVRNGPDVWVCAMTGRGGNCGPDYRASNDRSSWLDMFSLFKRRPTNVEASMSVEVPPGVRVDARANTGALEIHGTRAGVGARTLNGSITIDGAAGQIDARSVNGGIELQVDSLGPNDGISVETVNGGITAKLPPSTQGTVELSTVNGSVQSDFPLTASGEMSGHRVRGRIGESSRDIRLRTVNGSVELLKQAGGQEGEAPAAVSSPRR